MKFPTIGGARSSFDMKCMITYLLLFPKIRGISNKITNSLLHSSTKTQKVKSEWDDLILGQLKQIEQCCHENQLSWALHQAKLCWCCIQTFWVGWGRGRGWGVGGLQTLKHLLRFFHDLIHCLIAHIICLYTI